MNGTILPGATIGVLGSGQLGRMFAIAARRMGYRVHTLSPDTDTPTGQVADLEIDAEYLDLDAVRDFARDVDVVTFEFENVPLATVEAASEWAPVRPGGMVLHIAQHRLREKTFLAGQGFPVAPFRPVRSLSELEQALTELGTPAILKTAGFGYDGKGQWRLNAPGEAAAALQSFEGQEAVLERVVEFEREVSVVAARGLDGACQSYAVIENEHHHGILNVSVAPAAVAPEVARQATEMAHAVLEELEVVGVLCVEFFLTRAGRLLINEIAPRPHNSGHFSIDACVTSQFEQQLRAVCGLPLGSVAQHRPAAMCNLLGEVWQNGVPNWAAACAMPEVKLHLYGKLEPRPGRKMGHLTTLDEDQERAAGTVRVAREGLANRR